MVNGQELLRRGENMEIKIEDNSDDVLREMESAKERILLTIGLKAEGFAKKAAPVDTGTLRNSVANAVHEDDVYIGTNLEYAPYVELGTRSTVAKPYLKPAVLNHSATYKKIAEDIMKNT